MQRPWGRNGKETGVAGARGAKERRKEMSPAEWDRWAFVALRRLLVENGEHFEENGEQLESLANNRVYSEL